MDWIYPAQRTDTDMVGDAADVYPNDKLHVGMDEQICGKAQHIYTADNENVVLPFPV